MNLKQSKLLFVLMGVLILSFSTFASGQNLEKITFRLNWIPQANHCYFYVAKDKGFYEDVGLRVNIERGSGSMDAVKLMDTGKVDLAMADSTVAMTGIGEGADLKILAMVYQKTPFTFWTKKGRGIETLEDFEGATIGAPPGDAHRVFFPALAKENGIDVNKVKFVNMSAGAKIPAMASGKIDIEGNYWPTYPTQVETVGEENLRWFRWSEYGVDPYAKSIITSVENLKERPELVRNFLEATFKAWRWALINPRKAIEIEQKYVPETDVSLFVKSFKKAKDLMKSPGVLRHGLGWMDQEKMEYTARLVNKYQDPKNSVNASRVYTNEFLPHYTWPYPGELEN